MVRNSEYIKGLNNLLDRALSVIQRLGQFCDSIGYYTGFEVALMKKMFSSKLRLNTCPRLSNC